MSSPDCDSGAGGIIAAIILGIVLVLGALWLFNSGAFNSGGGSNVTIEAPTIQVPAPATPNVPTSSPPMATASAVAG